MNLGVTLAGLDRIDEAIESCEKALAIDPNIPAVHFNLAGLLDRQGATQRALHHYQQAVEGDDPEARRLALTAIEDLRSSQGTDVVGRDETP